MSVTRRSWNAETLLAAAASLLLVTMIALVTSIWLALRVGAMVDHRPAPADNPFAAVIDIADGKARWPGPAASAVTGCELLLILLAAAMIVSRRSSPRRRRVDKAAKFMASRRDHLEVSGVDAAAGVARRLGVRAAQPGVRVGRSLLTGAPVYGSWEMTHADIWGARRGKTTSRVVPAILDAPGAVVATSNKRDVVDTTWAVRAGSGPVWVFDPQAVANEPPSWWWDPLSYVTDVDKAVRLAAVLAYASRAPDARQDAYFDPKGEQLLAFLLLAAAEYRAPVTKVFEWTTDPTDTRPVDILHMAGHELAAEAVQGVINAPDKQRAGVYGTAEKIVNFLVNPAVAEWVTQGHGCAARPQFKPREFASGTGTLYLLSREGQGNAGPLVTALTVAAIEAAEELATRSPGGRLPVPLLCVLDEAANVCRWRDLPDLYSHYGSRGIVLMTMLQSWAQGVTVWGEQGMTKLWSSASIRVYGGGEVDPRFLGSLSQLIGDYDASTTSVSIQGVSAKSTTTSTRVEKILEVSDLAALPMGRALVFVSGSPPILVVTEPWHAGPHAHQIRAAAANAERAQAVATRSGYYLQPGRPRKGLEPGRPPAALEPGAPAPAVGRSGGPGALEPGDSLDIVRGVAPGRWALPRRPEGQR